MNMLAYDRTIVDAYKSKVLQNPGFDFEAQQRLVVYRKNRAYLV